MAPTSRAAHNKKKLNENLYIYTSKTSRGGPLITWLIDIKRQTLKCTQGKQSLQSYITLIVHQNVY